MSTPTKPLARWDHMAKFVEPSSRYIPGLNRVSQYRAACLLADRALWLNRWEAWFLQTVLYRPDDLDNLRMARLDMLGAPCGREGGSMSTPAHVRDHVGWTYSSSGTPCAFIMPPNDPANAMMVPCDTWWQALRFAMSFAENNEGIFVGGPE